MAAVIQRPLRGSRISSFYPVKTLPSLSSLDSAFQLQEYISLLIRLDVHDVETIVSIPGRHTGRSAKGDEVDKQKDENGGENRSEALSGEDKDGEKERKNEVAVDEACWIYEQLRRLAQDLSHPLITMLQQECTRASCPEMKAGEWLYLCVAHGNDGAMEQCCAIDYILHTLDSATALLNSPRAFPSRLQIPPTSHRHFSSLARRLGRIFAHAYFHHREAFEQAEAESSLYARFLALTSKFDLVPAEFLVIPSRMGHHEGDPVDRDQSNGNGSEVQPPRLLAASVQPMHAKEGREGSIDTKDTTTLGRELQQGSSPPGLGSTNTSSSAAWTESIANESGSGHDSPRKFGRSRTDTMVFSEAVTVVDELAKNEDRDTGRQGDDKIGGDKERYPILERDFAYKAEEPELPNELGSDKGEIASSQEKTNEPPESQPAPHVVEESNTLNASQPNLDVQLPRDTTAESDVSLPATQDESQLSDEAQEPSQQIITPPSFTAPSADSELPEIVIDNADPPMDEPISEAREKESSEEQPQHIPSALSDQNTEQHIAVIIKPIDESTSLNELSPDQIPCKSDNIDTAQGPPKDVASEGEILPESTPSVASTQSSTGSSHDKEESDQKPTAPESDNSSDEVSSDTSTSESQPTENEANPKRDGDSGVHPQPSSAEPETMEASSTNTDVVLSTEEAS